MSEIDDFLAAYPDNVKDLAEAARQFVTGNAEGCSETLHTGWKVISYGYRKKFCAIAPHAAHVNLQFHNGAGLDDPEGRLEGSGRAMRHVKLHSREDLNPATADLISVAAGEAK